jgi:hypothetical protein
MTQRVGKWKLEFAAAAPLSIHIHIAYGQLRRGSSLLGYVIKQRAAEKPSRILRRASEKRPSSVVSMASDIQDLPKNVTRCSFSSPSSAVDLALETSLMGNLGQGKICCRSYPNSCPIVPALHLVPQPCRMLHSPLRSGNRPSFTDDFVVPLERPSSINDKLLKVAMVAQPTLANLSASTQEWH